MSKVQANTAEVSVNKCLMILSELKSITDRAMSALIHNC